MSRFWKAMAAVVMVAMVATVGFSFAACSSAAVTPSQPAQSATAAGTTATPGTAPAETPVAPSAAPAGAPEIITWYAAYSEVPVGMNRVNEAESKYLQSKGLNVNFDLELLGLGDWSTRIATMISAQEEFDIFGNSISTIDTYAISGGIVEITDDMLSKYASQTISLIGQGVIDRARLNGKLYCLPVYKDMAAANGYVYNKTLADQYGIDVSGVHSVADWTAVFQKLHTAAPDVICYLPNYAGGPACELIDATNCTFASNTNNSVGMYLGDTGDKLVNLWAQDATLTAMKLFQSWYKAGYMNTDTTADGPSLVNGGKVFCIATQLKPGKDDEMTTDKVKWAQVQTSDNVVDSRSYPDGWGNAISSTSHTPELALQVLNEAFSDPDCINLMIYGQKDTDYTLSSDNILTVKSDGQYDISAFAWEFGNQTLNYVKNTESPDKWVKMKEFNDSAKVEKIAGFWYDPTECSTELTAISNVFSQYAALLTSGAADDVDSTMKEFLSALDKSGMQTLLDSVNKQFATFLSTK